MYMYFVASSNITNCMQAYLATTDITEWLMTQTPYFIHHTSKTPHITLC